MEIDEEFNDEKQALLALPELTPPCSNEQALIKRCHLYFENVKKGYVKTQKGKPKRYRIKSPLVQFSVEFPQGYDVRAHFHFFEYTFYVKRCEDDDVNDRMGEVARAYDYEQVIINENKISIPLDIDSEFLDASEKPVYRLNKSNKPREFILGARVRIDEKWAHCLSSPFTVRGETRNGRQSISSPPSSSKIDHIEADTINVIKLSADEIHSKNAVVVEKGDIAHNFPLGNNNENFFEAEVVGLKGRPNDNRTSVYKLNKDNISMFQSFGVISRQFYLQAKKPTDPNECTETICMFGQIPIRVVGEISQGDEVLPSSQHPGFGVSRSHGNKNLPVLGTALADKDQNGVVLSGVSFMEATTRINLENRIKRKFKKRLYGCITLVFLLMAAIGISVWQALPGSPIRYALCRVGSLSGTASYCFNSTYDHFSNPCAKGREFEFETLKHKVDFHSLYPMKKTDMHYFLNIDQCAYEERGEGKTKIHFGSYLFVINDACTEVYYYFTKGSKKKWWKYNSAHSIRCHFNSRGFMKTRKPGIFGPLLPLGFLTAYNYDAAHGDKIQRIRDEAESILEDNPALLSLPKGPITFEMVEERRLAQKEGGCVF